MPFSSLKSLIVSFFSIFFLLISTHISAQDEVPKDGLLNATNPEAHKEGTINAADVIMSHIMDAHEFHFADISGHPITIPLPVILYSAERGVDVFMSSNFQHGNADYKGYRYNHGHIVAVNPYGNVNEAIKVYDLSLTRNVVQMFLALILLVLLMINIARKYARNGATIAPSGFQNAIETVIIFVRDEVGKPNLGHKYEKYMPYLLTVFFFILINNIFGLIPGAANVTGNISFTLVLAFISMLVILFSTNGHFWGHIFWPPGVPFFVKVILIPVEFAGIFIKPIALMIRLFANMVAGHIVIICFISLIFIFGAMNTFAGIGFSPISLLFTVFIYFIELLVVFIQAFIFTNLTAVFIGQAFETGHGHEEGHGHAVAHSDPHPTDDGEAKQFAL